MRLKFNIPKEKKKKRTMFLLFPRWCAKCGIGVWLERIKLNHKGDPCCPECGGYLWAFKENAIEFSRAELRILKQE